MAATGGIPTCWPRDVDGVGPVAVVVVGADVVVDGPVFGGSFFLSAMTKSLAGRSTLRLGTLSTD